MTKAEDLKFVIPPDIANLVRITRGKIDKKLDATGTHAQQHVSSARVADALRRLYEEDGYEVKLDPRTKVRPDGTCDPSSGRSDPTDYHVIVTKR